MSLRPQRDKRATLAEAVSLVADMVLVEGAMYAINPDPPFIPPASNDASLGRGAAELAMIRSLDSLEVRKSEFSARELSRVFEHNAGLGCAC